jgi:hypothetical protein
MGPDTPPIRIFRADVAPTNDERYSVQGVYARNMKSYHLTLREQFQREYGVKYLYVRFFGSYAYFYFEDDNDEALRDLVTSHVALRMFRPEVAQRRRIGDVDARACQVNRGIEGIAAARQAEPAVVAAGQLDHDLADGDKAFLRLGHVFTILFSCAPGRRMAVGPGLGNRGGTRR